MNKKKTKQTKDWREVRRLQAWKLKEKGWRQNKIAEALGVSEGAVSQWIKRGQQDGEKGLRTRKGGGPTSRLSETQLKSLPDFLARGATAYGFRGEVWTRSRVGYVIKTE
ncbi:MAG: helix-turn-helix domain-containing protein, partial [Chloroflexota bacterium]